MAYEIVRGEYLFSDDSRRLDLDRIEAFLRASYWASERPRERIERSVANSMCFGIYSVDDERQVAFARVVTDKSDFAWLCDVFVDEAHRGKRLGKWLMECVVTHPELQGLRRWILATRDAHGLYAQFGYTPLSAPQIWMERRSNA